MKTVLKLFILLLLLSSPLLSVKANEFEEDLPADEGNWDAPSSSEGEYSEDFQNWEDRSGPSESEESPMVYPDSSSDSSSGPSSDSSPELSPEPSEAPTDPSFDEGAEGPVDDGSSIDLTDQGMESDFSSEGPVVSDDMGGAPEFEDEANLAADRGEGEKFESDDSIGEVSESSLPLPEDTGPFESHELSSVESSSSDYPMEVYEGN